MKTRTAVIVTSILLITGCAANTPAPGPTDGAPATQWSDAATPIQPTLNPTPAGQIDYEPTAAAAGAVPYSGYTCTFSNGACSCDETVVISASFTFQEGDRLSYEFRGETYGATWDMGRLGPNQWTYTIPIGVDETSGTPNAAGNYFIVLTFTSDGFTLLQSQDNGDGTQVTCPEVPYTRLSAVTPAP